MPSPITIQVPAPYGIVNASVRAMPNTAIVAGLVITTTALLDDAGNPIGNLASVSIAYTGPRPAGVWSITIGDGGGRLVNILPGDDVYELYESSSSDITGARTLSITVLANATSTPIEAARVRIYRTGSDGTAVTGANGAVAMARDNATWNVTVSAAGYQTLATTLVVTADASVEWRLVLDSSDSTYPSGSPGL